MMHADLVMIDDDVHAQQMSMKMKGGEEEEAGRRP